LLADVALGRLSFAEFLDQYDNFYWAYALDGHEAEPDEVQLTTLSARIEPHRRVAEEVLAALASESDAQRASYRSSGRIGAAEALVRLKLIARALPSVGSNNSFKGMPLRGTP